MSFPYEDIVDLPHHVSKKHPPMSRINRAAQFAPFAALTGHGAAIKETARLTDAETDLTNDNKEILNLRHKILLEHQSEQPEVTIIYFVPDERKSGGSYKTKTGKLDKINECEKIYILTDGSFIHMDHILYMDSKLFSCLELE